jgi:hypothetical protein
MGKCPAHESQNIESKIKRSKATQSRTVEIDTVLHGALLSATSPA